MERAPETCIETILSLSFRRPLNLGHDAVASVIHDDVQSAEMLFHFPKSGINLFDGGDVEREDEKLRRRIFLCIGGEDLGSSECGYDALVCCQYFIEKCLPYALRATGDYGI